MWLFNAFCEGHNFSQYWQLMGSCTMCLASMCFCRLFLLLDWWPQTVHWNFPSSPDVIMLFISSRFLYPKIIKMNIKRKFIKELLILFKTFMMTSLVYFVCILGWTIFTAQFTLVTTCLHMQGLHMFPQSRLCFSLPVTSSAAPATISLLHVQLNLTVQHFWTKSTKCLLHSCKTNNVI